MRYDVVPLITELGIEPLDQKDEEVIARCPKHDDTGRPNWSINNQTGQHHCWSCGFGGGVLSLIADRLGLYWPDSEDLNLMEARKWARRFRSNDLTTAKALTPTVYKPKQGKQTLSIEEQDLALFTTPPSWALGARRLTQAACIELGVLWSPRQDAWITPIRDPWTHALRGWQVKAQRDRYFRNHPMGVDKHSTLFGLTAFTQGIAILVESPLDVVRLHSAGVSGGLSSFGAAVSDDQINVLLAYADAVIIATDNPRHDDAGKTSALQLVRKLGPRMPTRVLNYDATSAKDIGDMTTNEIYHAISNSYSATPGRRAVHA